MGYCLFLCHPLLLWEGLIPTKNTRTNKDKQLSVQLLIFTCPLPLTPVQAHYNLSSQWHSITHTLHELSNCSSSRITSASPYPFNSVFVNTSNLNLPNCSKTHSFLTPASGFSICLGHHTHPQVSVSFIRYEVKKQRPKPALHYLPTAPLVKQEQTSSDFLFANSIFL